MSGFPVIHVDDSLEHEALRLSILLSAHIVLEDAVVDDREYVDKAIEKARELNCSDSIWNGSLTEQSAESPSCNSTFQSPLTNVTSL